MPNPQGTRVVERDREVLAALAMARYLTGDQVARLAFAGRDERVPRRRLNRLATTGAYGLDPLVRALAYRGALGAPLKAWALTEAGYVVAKELVPHATVPAADVGAPFIEHTLLLNDVLVDLILGTRASPAGSWFADLPFRWLAEGGDCLEFDYYDRRKQAIERGRIRPDATLEIVAARRRLFLECETGSRTLVSADPTNTGATCAKIQRYANLIAGAAGQHDTTTPYSLIYRDGFVPTVVFLAHSDRRRDAIRALVADPKRPVRIEVGAFTFQEAARALVAVAPGDSLAATRVADGRHGVPGDAWRGTADEERASLERSRLAGSHVRPAANCPGPIPALAHDGGGHVR